MTLVIAFALLFLHPGPVRAARVIGGDDLRVERVSFDEGVSHQYIYCSLQDSRGFMWFGTMVGLVRYDGVSNTIYRHDPSDTASLPNDDIVCLAEDDSSNIWIGTFGGGLIRFDRASGRFTRFDGTPGDTLSEYRSIVWGIQPDAAGMLWLAAGEGGLVRFDPRTGGFTHFMNDPASEISLPSGVVTAVAKTPDGAVWAGTGDGGLARITPGENTFTRFLPQGGNYIRALHVDRGGRLWAGTQGGGLFRYDGKAGFTNYRFDPEDVRTIGSDYINCMEEDEEGAVWVGTYHGLSRFHPDDGHFDRYRGSPDDEHSLPGNNIVTIRPDRSGVLWVGAYLGGLAKILPASGFGVVREGEGVAKEIGMQSVSSFLEIGPSSLLVGTAGGVREYDPRSGILRDHPLSKSLDGAPRRRVVTSMIRDRQGRIWIGTLQGLVRVDGDGRETRVFVADPTDSSSLSSGAVSALCEDRSGEIWVGTQAGLNRFMGDESGFRRYRYRRGNPESIANDYILSLYEDRRGDLWIGTYRGINRIGPDRTTFTLFQADPTDTSTVSNNYCFAITQDSAGDLWLGTGGGLNRFIPESGTFEHFTEHDGLPNSVICAIEESPPGTFWVSTQKGLSRFDVRSREFRNFDILDGLQGNMFTPGASLRTTGGLVLFGGRGGFNAFYPDDIARRLYIPPVVITGVEFTPGEPENPLRPEVRGELRLAYTDNSFNVRAAALDFTRPEKISYAFKLEGYDADWIQTRTKNQIRYTGISPGEYVLRVKATNSDGLWSGAGASLPITITPPFWRTWWFLALFSFGIAGMALTVHRRWMTLKLRRVVEIEQIRETERKIIRKRAADDFHDEFGHKLTKISLLGQVVKRNLTTSPAESAGALEKIIATSAELSMGMRDFLWTLNPDRDSAYDVAVRLKDFGDDLFNSAGIGFQVEEFSPALEEVKLNVEWRRHLILMFKEGMNNIVKHAKPARVLLHVERMNGSIEITLSDDGEGFDQGTVRAGQGLASMRHRAEKLHGALLLKTAAGAGTTITFHGDIPKI